MMEIELPKTQQSQQDMELIDILWRQDIDLGAEREVFDYSHRQKEHELRRQRELEEEERQQRLREQEKALLAQLQLDEETGEFVPRPLPTAQPGPVAAQTAVFAEDGGDTLSFDECMQLLEETFPLVETIEAAPPALETSVTPQSDSSPGMMGPPPASLLSAVQSTQKPLPDLEQAWMELLSIPELQQCLSMNMDEMLETSAYPTSNISPSVQESDYPFYTPKLTDVVASPAEAGPPPAYQDTFEGSFAAIAPPENLSQMTLKASDVNAAFNVDSFCDMFYPDLTNANAKKPSALAADGNESGPLAEVQDEPANPMEIPEFALSEGFEDKKAEVMAEFPDSDSGLSLDASPSGCSPQKSAFGDGSFGYSDSDMEEMDSNPGSMQSEYAEMFPSSFGADGFQGDSSIAAQPSPSQEPNVKHTKTESVDGVGHSKPPFAKDKQKRRAESRLSRDEQRAKALQIPFTVDLIINLPVDDFNEMMSKHQLNEAQLALVRDIRRRGKNKVAAQNCRKRKMESIAGLESELDSLREEKERLQREKAENDSSLRRAKQQLSSLYQEVFGMLRDEEGRPYSPSEYSLQQSSDGNVFLVPRIKKTSAKSSSK
ncbi:nuclear factor erythroid 2-related factor 2a [Scleropages formosus]|uniref:Nfe2 like bZIP transcription factor 2a n=1 Tax=Scleropages formosus TaxID=113540 RepID=A0A8C9VF97_SCLFO|nr:nuclear factor erythroid 2-related factor 2 [Scleropages formosus]